MTPDDGSAPTYCERWDHVAHVPFLPLTEEQARDRFENGPWFTVVLPSEDRPGEAGTVLEIETGLTTVTVLFFDDDTGAVLDRYVFRRDGDTLLFAEGTRFDPPDDGRRGLSAVAKTQQIFVRADGFFDIVVDERDDDGVQYADDNPVDITTYLETVPAFGDWASLARWER